jgi:predicted Rossmann fold flavoprotein
VKQANEIRTWDVIVVGAGAAGQLAAITAGQAGRSVLLLEQLTQPGRKILASGGGRCNLTNLDSPADVSRKFGRQGRFVLPALEALEPGGLVAYLNRLDFATVVEDNSKVFPASQKAIHVQNFLREQLETFRVEMRFSRPVKSLWIENGVLRGVETRDSRCIAGACVILTCGGRSYAELGGTGGGYTLAEQAGHSISPLTPALVPLVTRERWCAKLAGVSLSGARVWLPARGQSKTGVMGDVLFTHKGLSGPAILDLSGNVAQQLLRDSAVTLKMEFLAGQTPAVWEKRFDEWRRTQGRRRVARLLQQHLPTRLCEILIQQANVSPETTAAELTRDGKRNLSTLLGGAELTVVDTEGFEAAFVTRGGVSLRDVDPATLRSKLLPGLFFAGELLDLDGPTGGYNLRWAFSSGLLAGRAAAEPFA